jgi:CHAD domain-containing protein
LKPDPQTIHHARVAVRRLRSHLRTFGPVLDERRARDLEARLSWLQDGLSHARDADVFLAGLRRLGTNLPDGDRRDIEHLVNPFEEARDRAYQRLRESLCEPPYVALLDDIIEAARRPPLAIDTTRPAREIAPSLIDCAWSKLRKRVRCSSEPPSDRELHRIRIAAKRMRYVCEALAPVAGRRVQRLAQHSECLQTVLGDQHDAVVTCERLRSLANDSTRAFTAGELAAEANAAALRARADWQKTWRAAKRCRSGL